jgi:hypothetical protein
LPDQIAVAFWDLAAFDAMTFTVAELRNFSTGSRERHDIEVLWSDVERSAHDRIDIVGSVTPLGAAVEVRVPIDSGRAEALLAAEKFSGRWREITPDGSCRRVRRSPATADRRGSAISRLNWMQSIQTRSAP